MLLRCGLLLLLFMTPPPPLPPPPPPLSPPPLSPPPPSPPLDLMFKLGAEALAWFCGSFRLTCLIPPWQSQLYCHVDRVWIMGKMPGCLQKLCANWCQCWIQRQSTRSGFCTQALVAFPKVWGQALMKSCAHTGASQELCPGTVPRHPVWTQPKPRFSE